jgi:CO/xanthine dehydrogenase Mo-binding subunit
MAGDRAGLVEAVGVEQVVDALPDGQPAARVLARDPLFAAHATRQLLAAAQLLELRLPGHDRSPNKIAGE